MHFRPIPFALPRVAVLSTATGACLGLSSSPAFADTMDSLVGPHPHYELWFLLGGLVAMLLVTLLGGALWGRILRRRVAQSVEAVERQKRKLHESEARFRLLVEHQQDFMLQTDANFRVVYASPSYRAFRGYSRDEDMAFSLERAVHPEEYETITNWMQILRRPPYKAEAMLRMQSVSGWRWTHWNARGVLEKDTLTGIVFVGRDSHRRVLAQKALARSLHQERILRSCARRLLGRIGSGRLLQESLDELRNASGVTCLAVYQNTMDQQAREVAGLQDISGDGEPCEKLLSSRPDLLYFEDLPGWWRALSSNEELHLPVDGLHSSFGGQLAGTGVEAASVLPLAFGGEWRGFLLVLGDEDALEEARGGSLLSTAAEMIGSFMGRRQALKALRESEERYSLAVLGSKDGLWDWDLKGNQVYFSPRWKEIIGYAAEELPNDIDEWKKRVHPDDLDFVIQTHQDYMDRRTRSMEIEYRLRHKNGSYRWIAGKGVCLWDDDGVPYRMAGTHTDITERKRIENASNILYRVSRATNTIRDLQELYETIFEVLSSTLGTDSFLVAILDRERNVLTYPFSRDVVDGDSFEDVDLSVFDGESLVMRVVRSESVLFIPESELKKTECIGTRPKVWLGAPIQTKTGVIGAVAIQDYDDPYRYTARDGDMLASVTELISMAMERQKVERALWESEESYRNLFRSAQVGLFRSREQDGSILECNEQFALMLGYASRTHCISQGDMNRHYAPSHSRNQLLNTLRENDEIKNYELPMLRLDGKLIWVRYSVNRQRETGWLEGVCEDMTVEKANRREREILLQTLAARNAELDKAREYVKSIIESMPSMLVSVDREMRVVEWNQEAEHMTGLKAEEASGLALKTVMPSLSKYEGKVRSAIATNKPVSLSRVKVVRGDTLRFFDAMIYPLSGRSGGAVVRVDDVTNRVQIEEMMVQTEKMMSVGGLAAGMAHEINNPLGIILQGIQGAHRRLSPGLAANVRVAEELGVDLEKIAQYMERRGISSYLEGIREAGVRASRIVSNMLNFSRSSSTDMEPNDLNLLLDKAVSLAGSDYDLKKRYDFKRVNIKRDYAKNLPLVPCQATEIEQVVLNLLKNATQAFATCDAPEDGFWIRLATRKVHGFVSVSVEDNGPGMSEETARRVFEPFYTTKEPGVGTGLGLSVSYFIITQIHSGRFRVESTPGRGTRFVFQLPLEISAERKADETGAST